MDREEIRMAVQNVLQQAPLTMRQLAEEAGVSYGALRGWAIGRRVPDAESVERLGSALRRRAERLQELAKQLERTSGE